MRFLSEAGQGLTQVLVAGGLMAAVGAGVTTMIVNQGKEITRLEAKQESIDLKNGLAMTLTGGGCCPIGNTKIGDVTISEGQGQVVFSKFFKNCPSSNVKADQVPVHLSSDKGPGTHLRSVSIKKMRLDGISSVSKGAVDRFTANLIIDVESKSNFALKNIMLPINFEASYPQGKKSGTKYISSCTSSYSGDSDNQYPGSGVIVYPSQQAGRVDPYSEKGFSSDTASTLHEQKAVFIVPSGVKTLSVELAGASAKDESSGSSNPGHKCFSICKVTAGEKCKIVIDDGKTIKNKNYVPPKEGDKYVNFGDGNTDAKIGTFKDEFTPGSSSIACDSGCYASAGGGQLGYNNKPASSSSNIEAFSCASGGAGENKGQVVIRW